MNREELLELTKEEAEKLRESLAAFDDARKGWMLKQWSKVSDSPQKAGWTGLALFTTGFILGVLFF